MVRLNVAACAAPVQQRDGLVHEPRSGVLFEHEEAILDESQLEAVLQGEAARHARHDGV